MIDNIDSQYFLQVHGSDTIGNISDTDISVSCPLCMEGKSWKRKHRLHLYTKPSYENPAVHCWNCGYSSNLYGYLKEHYSSAFEAYVKAKRGKGFSELKIKTEASDKNLPELNIKIEKEIPQEKIPVLIDKPEYFDELPSDVLAYLKGRGLEPKKDWLYSKKDNKINFNDADITLSEYIIIPLSLGDKWYGFQALGWKEKRFFIYLVKGNSSWKIWNWFNIDKDKPVYIFESVYDAMSSGLDNIISQLGANMSEERLSELKTPIFCMDNFRIDERAKIELGEYSKNYKVFIWPKKTPDYIKDFNDLRKKKVPYEQISNMIKSNIKTGLPASIEIKMS